MIILGLALFFETDLSELFSKTSPQIMTSNNLNYIVASQYKSNFPWKLRWIHLITYYDFVRLCDHDAELSLKLERLCNNDTILSVKLEIRSYNKKYITGFVILLKFRCESSLVLIRDDGKQKHQTIIPHKTHNCGI